MFGPFKIFLLALALSTAQAAPTIHTKRIAQVISDSTQKWEAACVAAKGGQKCNPVSITAFSTLLAAAGPCDQQDAADQMIDLAKQLNNDPQMIELTQIFCQQPRNSPNSVSIPYCQKAPKNSELSGLFQCQFAGSKAQTFVGGVQVGSPGTIPFGLSSPLNPAGSCPANPDGPVPDGQQLVDITQNPGNGGDPAPAPASSGGQDKSGGTRTGVVKAPPPEPTPSDITGPSAGGTRVPDPNAPPAEPTPSDITGVVNAPAPAPTPSDITGVVNAPAPAPTPSDITPQAGGFKLQNGKDAQKLNAQFDTLTPDSSCTDGESACVSGGFAQCVGGKFVGIQCPQPLICAALPLVNKPGTSIACTTKDDALTRIANTGAQGGLTGSG